MSAAACQATRQDLRLSRVGTDRGHRLQRRSTPSSLLHTFLQRKVLSYFASLIRRSE